MRTIEVNIYKFDELNDKAKEVARNWWRETFCFDDDTQFESAVTAAGLLGIEFADKSVPLIGGGVRIEADIRYSGFSSQGDGASFVGTYSYRPGSPEAVLAEFPTDTVLQGIALRLADVQARYGNRVRAKITQDGRYYHAMTMDADVFTGIVGTDDEDDFADDAASAAILDLMRQFANWIYSGLNADYDYQMGDENIDDSMDANEYEFYENGERAVKP